MLQQSARCELLEVAARSSYARFELLAGGVCTECYSPLEREIAPAPPEADLEYAYRTTCERCGFTTQSAAAAALLREPAFVSFCHDHGLDVRERLPWTLTPFLDSETRQASADPPRYEIHLEMDDDAIEVTLDGHGDVVAAAEP